MQKQTKLGLKLFRATSVVLLLIMLVGIAWHMYSEKRQAEAQLLEQSRVITSQLLSLRAVMAENQHAINYNRAGEFEFKHLNPAAVAQQVGEKFNGATNYIIKQTRIEPRLKENTPDDFERQQLVKFAQTKAQEHWQITEYNGKNVFRYMAPLYMEPSCLECHGGPKGQVDVSGYPKEGLKVGQLAGAISLVLPMDLFEANMKRTMLLHIILTVAVVVFTGIATYIHTSLFVNRPMEQLTMAVDEMGRGNLQVNLTQMEAYGEVKDLAVSFQDMAHKLRQMYDQLEEKVWQRTRELNEANQELERVSNYKSEFLAIMSHELRTPLTSILAFTDMMLAGLSGPITKEQEEYLQDVKTSGKQLLSMINELLDFAKIEAGRMDLTLEVLAVEALLTNSVNTLRPLALSRKQEIRLEVEKDLPYLVVDGEKLKQVVVNLVGNALKFSQDGGLVEVKAFMLDEESFCLQVSDNGIGIAKEQLEVIFEPFRQVEATALNRKYKGTGLGLALVKRIVELHQGKVEVHSTIGKGTVFTVMLPLLKGDLE